MKVLIILLLVVCLGGCILIALCYGEEDTAVDVIKEQISKGIGCSEIAIWGYCKDCTALLAILELETRIEKLELIKLEEEALQDETIAQLLRYPKYYSFDGTLIRVDAPVDNVRKVTVERDKK